MFYYYFLMLYIYTFDIRSTFLLCDLCVIVHSCLFDAVIFVPSIVARWLIGPNSVGI